MRLRAGIYPGDRLAGCDGLIGRVEAPYQRIAGRWLDDVQRYIGLLRQGHGRHRPAHEYEASDWSEQPSAADSTEMGCPHGFVLLNMVWVKALTGLAHRGD